MREAKGTTCGRYGQKDRWGGLYRNRRYPGTSVQREIRLDVGKERGKLGDMPKQARLEERTELDAWDR
jgi:hypothetical protein